MPDSMAVQEASPAEKKAITSASSATMSRALLCAAAYCCTARAIFPTTVAVCWVCWAVFWASRAAWAYLRFIFCFCIHLDRTFCRRSSGWSRRAFCHASSARSVARRCSA